MKFFIKKIYIIFFLLTTLLIKSDVFAKESSIQYKKEDISNYFSGIISINQVHNRSEERRVGKECRSRWSPYH